MARKKIKDDIELPAESIGDGQFIAATEQESTESPNISPINIIDEITAQNLVVNDEIMEFNQAWRIFKKENKKAELYTVESVKSFCGKRLPKFTTKTEWFRVLASY